MCVKRCVVIAALCLLGAQKSRAETLYDALAHTYLTHPKLNAQRASTRGIDEKTAIALGSFYPTASVQGSVGLYRRDAGSQGNQPFNQLDQLGLLRQRSDTRATIRPYAGALIVNLNIFNGFRSINGLNQAEALIRQSRQSLRYIELAVLHASAAAYVDLLRDTALFELNERYVQILKNQVEVTRQRLETSHVTQTDLYQAEAALAQAKQASAMAFVNLQKSISNYRQHIGRAPGSTLEPAPSLNKLIPKSLKEALRRADADHPLAIAADFNVKAHELDVEIQQGGLLPKVDLVGYVGQQQYASTGPTTQSLGYPGYPTQQSSYLQSSSQRVFDAGASLQLNMPLYEGGVVYAHVRQAKERLSEAQFLREQQIREIHQSIESAWAAWKNADEIVTAAKDQVVKAEAAVSAMRSEVALGQRTSWDILNAQLVLVNARSAFVNAQRDRILSAYSLLAATGQLSVATLRIPVRAYDATKHYESVKFQWFGTEPWN